MFNIFSFFKKELKPYNSGFLPQLDGHQIFYQEIGNPKGDIVLFFHAGPGGRSNPQRADIFDLKKHRIIMFDQRGCGNTISENILHKNTIQQTILDAKRLLDFLNIKEKVIVYGCSFGSACALLFSSQYKKCVRKIVLTSVFLGNTSSVHMFDEVCALFYPDIQSLLSNITGNSDIVDYFYYNTISDDVKKQKEALQYYGALEHQMGSTSPSFPKIEEIDPQRLNSFRIYMHYLKNNMFLKENELLNQTSILQDIPVYIFHNRLDMTCPVVNAYELSQKLRHVKLFIVEDTGHISKKLFDCAKERLANI